MTWSDIRRCVYILFHAPQLIRELINQLGDKQHTFPRWTLVGWLIQQVKSGMRTAFVGRDEEPTSCVAIVTPLYK